MTDFYLAAAFSQTERMQSIARLLREMGHSVTSRWINQGPDEQTVRKGLVVDPMRARRHAAQDIFDIERCDKVLMFTDAPSTTGGYHAEFGYALGVSKPVILIGARTNIFHCLPIVENWFSNWAAFVDYLEAFDAASRS